ncbi:MAG TPA: MATE family efflux transporter [Clostridia bacterium]|nr:MATE family efflux transporter [Clostridia bacterium]
MTEEDKKSDELRDRRRTILRLAWPAILEMAFYMLVWIVDTAMVGRLGAAALSAVGLGGQFYWTVTWVFGSIGIGTTIVVARYVGAANFDRARKAGEQALGMAFVIGLVVWAGVWYSSPWFFRLSGAESVVEMSGTVYIRVISLSTAPWIAGYAASGVLRGWGDTRTPLYIAAIGNALNVVGDYALIFGRLGFPALGVSGAAYASAGSIIVRFCLSLVAVLRKENGNASNAYNTYGPGNIARPGLRFTRIFSPDFGLMGLIARLSVPAGLEAFLVDGARTVNMVFLTTLGTVAFAAHQVVIVAESLSFMPGYGFAVASTVLVGQRLGEGNIRRAEEDTKETVRLSLMLMSLTGVLLAAFPGPILRLFTDEAGVIARGIPCLMLAALEQPLLAVADTLSAALKGAGDTKGPFYIAAVASWGFRVPLMFLAVRVLGYPLPVAWIIIVAGVGFQAILIYRRYRKGDWKRIKLE